MALSLSITGYQREGGPELRYFNARGMAFAVAALGTVTVADGTGRAWAEDFRLLALGDSLTAGYGLAQEDAFPAQLQQALAERGYAVEVLNGGVSGDTTAGGLARLDWALADAPDAVLLELGSNDGLRGIDPASTRDNLSAILDRLTVEGVPTLIAGMYAPPNLGPEYGQAFNAIYPDLAERYDAPLYDFFLEGVAAVPELNQLDGIHPNAEGVKVIVEGIVPHVIQLLEGVSADRQGDG